MATRRPILLLTAVVFLLLSPPPQAESFLMGDWWSLLSISRSLIDRVANARAARGDLAGASRARKISDHLRLLGRRGILSYGWDFASNYAFRGGFSAVATGEILSSAAELLAAIGEASRIKSAKDTAQWVLGNYDRLLKLSKSLFKGLLLAFSRSGPLREAVLEMQREVIEGELLKDCLMVGAADLDGLLRIARDLFFSAASRDTEL